MPDYAGVLTINYFEGPTFTSVPMQLMGGNVTLSAESATTTTTGGSRTGGGKKK